MIPVIITVSIFNYVTLFQFSRRNFFQYFQWSQKVKNFFHPCFTSVVFLIVEDFILLKIHYYYYYRIIKSEICEEHHRNTTAKISISLGRKWITVLPCELERFTNVAIDWYYIETHYSIGLEYKNDDKKSPYNFRNNYKHRLVYRLNDSILYRYLT